MNRIFFNLKNYILTGILLVGFVTTSFGQCPTAAAVITRTHTDISCFGANDGTITVELGNGAAPMNFELYDNIAGAFVTLAVTEVNDPDGNGNFRKVRYEDVYSSSFQVVVFKTGCLPPLQISETPTGFNILEPTQLVITVDAVDPDCNPAVGVGDGGVDITASGGIGPYTYLWTDGSTAEDRTNLDAGAYTVTVTDANGCQVNQLVNIAVSTQANAGPPTGLTCGTNSFALSANSPGAGEIGTWSGPAGVTFSPNANDPNATANNLNAGANTLTWLITDTGGLCSGTSDNIVVTYSPSMVLNTVITNVNCNGASTGAINLTVTSGGVGPFTYLWSNGATTEDLTNIPQGTYSVTVTDAATCTASVTNLIVTQPTALLLTPGTPTVALACNGDTNGAGSFTASQGTPGYTFTTIANTAGATITTTATTASFTGAGQGIVTIEVQDANGCTTQSTITITQPPALILNTTADVVLACSTNTNGTGTFTASGGTPGYTFTVLSNTTGGTVTTNATQLSFTNGGLGSINVEVRDANNCVTNATINITSSGPTLTVGTVATDNSRCVAPFNGSVNLTVGGSAGPFNYSWTGPSFSASTEDISGLNSGTYNVVVTDVPSGCTISTSANVGVNVPTLSTTNVVTNNTRCVAPFNGAINLSVSGAPGPFSFVWTGPSGFSATTEDISTLVDGTYNVTVTDNVSGCTTTASIAVGLTVPTLTTSSVVTNNTRCVAPFSGAVNLTVGGSAGPFTFVWSGPGGFSANTEDIAALQNGTYNVTITDTGTGCTTTASAVVGNTLPTITINRVITNNTRCVAPFNGAINATIAGTATGPFSYSWSGPGGFTATTEDITALQPGTYTLIVTDNTSGCTATRSNTVGNTPPTITLTNTVTNNTRCVAPFNGAINLTVSGVAGPFTFSWTGPSGFTAATEDISTLATGSYTVLVTHTATGCTSTANINVGNTPPTLSITNAVTNDTKCTTPFNGAIDITVSGSVGPFSYLWNGPSGFSAATEDIAAVDNGSYTVTVTDLGTGCTTNATIAVGDGAPTLTLTNVVTNNTNCVAPFNGAIDLSVSGATGPLTFAWTGPSFTASTEDIAALNGGSYSVLVTDNNSGCTATATINVANAASSVVITGNGVTDNTKCTAPFNGAIAVTVSGSPGPFTYSWTGPSGFTASTEDIVALGNGLYQLTVTDNITGCSNTFSATVNNNLPTLAITASTITDNTNCLAPFNGAIAITVGGAAGPFTYSWSGPNSFAAATEDISGLEPGAYSVLITDNVSGCTVTGSFNVGNTTTPIGVTNVVTNNTNCVAPFNGAINLTITGGVGPFNFVWTGPSFNATTEDISGLAPGAYSVVITDTGSGCVANGSFTVNDTPITLGVTGAITDNTSCVAPFNGAVDITITGSTGPFTISWSGPSFTSASEDISALQPGTYNVTVTDNASGCTATGSFVVNDTPTSLSITGLVTDNASCVAPFTGAVDIAVAGSPGPFTFSWSGPSFTATTEDITALAAGTYDVTVTDNVSGCSATASFVVNSTPTTLAVTGTTTDNTSCLAPFTGSIDITATGGVGVLSFSWTGPNGFSSTSEDLTALQDGSYVVTVTDGAGCTTTGNFAVGLNAAGVTIASVTTNNTKCVAPFTGTIDITLGGTPGPYSFLWSGPNGFSATTEDVTALEDGSYTVLVTDNVTGCTATATIAVGTTFPTVTISGTVTDNSKCVAPFNGVILLSTTPAVGAYAFAWTGPNSFVSNNKNITALESGAYQVTVTELTSGCTFTQSFTVGSNAPTISIAADVNSPNTSCSAPFDGVLLITASGGSGAYSFAWTGPNGFSASTEDIANVEDGDYTVNVTDLNLGCTATATFTVIDNTPVIALASQTIVDNTQCQAPFDGSITVTGGGSPGPYSFAWTGPNGFSATGAAITGLASGDYTVVITDITLGCSDSYTLTVNDATPPITITVDSTTPNTVCQNPFDGAIAISVTGTPGPFDFAWTGPNAFASTDEDPSLLEDGDYTVIVTDQLLGCTATLTVNVGNNRPTITVTANAITPNTNCVAPFNGALDVSAAGPAGTYDFAWTGPNGFVGTGAIISSLEPGDYTVIATNQTSGCTGTATFTVPNNAPSITITPVLVVENTQCQPPFDGSISVTASGTPGPFVFTWTGPNGYTGTGAGIPDLESGDYTVTATDPNGCTGTATINVPDNTPTIVITTSVAPNTNCVAPFDGAIDIITITGTAGPHSFLWSGPNGFSANTPSISDLEPGDYSITITDDILGCTDTYIVNVPDNAQVVSATPAITANTVCLAPFNGAIDVTISGTAGPFDFAWSGPNGFNSTSEDITGLEGGDYVLTVTDQTLGCTNIFTFNVPDNSVSTTVTLVSQVNNTSCQSPFNGALTINVGGTPGPFTISWTGPGGFTSAATSINALAPGTYTVTATDDNLGCTVTNSFTILNNATGCGGLNCAAFTTFKVADLPKTKRPTCGEQKDGVITIEIVGGTMPYIVTLTASDGTEKQGLVTTNEISFDQLGPDVYKYKVVDAALNVCELTYNLPVEPTVIASASAFVDATCFGSNTGQAILTVSGGNAPYDYFVNGQWFLDYVPGNVITNLPPDGTYNILVRDDATDVCADTVSVTINNANPAIALDDFTVSEATCAGSDGSITAIAASGGVGGPYQFALDGGSLQSENEFFNLGGGAHTLTIQDGSGCERSFTIDVSFPGFIELEKVEMSEATCDNNAQSGALFITFKNAGTYEVGLSSSPLIEPAEYLPPFTTTNVPMEIPNLPAGRYYVFVKSSSSECPSRHGPYDILGVPALEFDIVAECVDNKVNLSLRVTPSSPVNTIRGTVRRILTGEKVADIGPTTVTQLPIILDFDDHAWLRSAGAYSIELEQLAPDEFACIIKTTHNYVVKDQLTAQLISTTESYPDIATGTMHIGNFGGGTTPYQIQIDLVERYSELDYLTVVEEVEQNSNLQYEKKYDHLPAGSYEVTITDSLGCVLQFPSLAIVERDRDIYIPNIFTPNDDGSNDVFFIRNLPEEGTKLVITNRWGKQVYSTNSYQNNWDANDVEDGIYYYQLKPAEGAALMGWVEVMRGTKP